jgi:hypothetical protein
MTAEDMAIIDRIERLAFQAGVATGSGKQSEPPKTEAEKKVLAALRGISKECPSYEGSMYAIVGYNLEWSDIHALNK